VNRQPPAPATVGAALDWARRERITSESAPLEAQALLAHLLHRSRSWILAHPEADLPPDLFTEYSTLIRRAADGEPLAYLTGSREFFGLDFEVTTDVLIPRPETELLVETAQAWFLKRRKKTNHPIRIVDLGTGCGCIAAALAVHAPDLRVTATDISFRALAVAARNLSHLGVRDRVLLLQADLLTPLRGPIDLLCANLPYVPAATLDSLPVVRYEPRIALDGGPDGLRLIARALAQCPARLAPDGSAFFEIETPSGQAAADLARRFFPTARVQVLKDLAGRNRLLQIQLPGQSDLYGPVR
jgi:release factor glutamine methyltransferase